jgi:hypothetical protein
VKRIALTICAILILPNLMYAQLTDAQAQKILELANAIQTDQAALDSANVALATANANLAAAQTAQAGAQTSVTSANSQSSMDVQALASYINTLTTPAQKAAAAKMLAAMPQKKKPHYEPMPQPPCGIPNCTCGCQQGQQCTCTCNRNGPCNCPATPLRDGFAAVRDRLFHRDGCCQQQCCTVVTTCCSSNCCYQEQRRRFFFRR